MYDPFYFPSFPLLILLYFRLFLPPSRPPLLPSIFFYFSADKGEGLHCFCSARPATYFIVEVEKICAAWPDVGVQRREACAFGRHTYVIQRDKWSNFVQDERKGC